MMRGSDGAPSDLRECARARRRVASIAALILGAAVLLWHRQHLGDAAAAWGPVRPTATRGPVEMFSPPSLRAYADGHARPRALAVDARGDRLYVAASTADRLYVVDLQGPLRHVEAELPICAFPDALAALPTGGVVVSCRFDPGLRRVIPRHDGAAAGPNLFDVQTVWAGAEHGNRGLALDPLARFAYVGSPARGGVKIVELSPVNPGAPPVPSLFDGEMGGRTAPPTRKRRTRITQNETDGAYDKFY